MEALKFQIGGLTSKKLHQAEDDMLLLLWLLLLLLLSVYPKCTDSLLQQDELSTLGNQQ
jgi:hypothetical protein